MLIAVFITSLVFLTACGDNGNPAASDYGTGSESAAEILVRDLPADPERTGTFTYFSLRDNTVVSSTNAQTGRWDLAFKSTSILTNSGVSGPGQGGGLVLSGVDFDDLSELPASGWQTDASGLPAIDHSAWYTYTGSEGRPPHAILMNPGVVLGVRTADGRYAKMQIVSYYKGGASVPTGAEGELARFYTFRYVFQPDGSRQFD